MYQRSAVSLTRARHSHKTGGIPAHTLIAAYKTAHPTIAYSLEDTQPMEPIKTDPIPATVPMLLPGLRPELRRVIWSSARPIPLGVCHQ